MEQGVILKQEIVKKNKNLYYLLVFIKIDYNINNVNNIYNVNNLYII